MEEENDLERGNGILVLLKKICLFLALLKNLLGLFSILSIVYFCLGSSREIQGIVQGYSLGSHVNLLLLKIVGSEKPAIVP